MTTPWRDQIAIHPAADIFPLLGDLELIALGDDIKRNGLTSPIAVMVENDKPLLLDGRNRLDAMERVGWRIKITKDRRGWHLRVEGDYEEGYVAETTNYGSAVDVIPTHIDPAEYVASVNIHRRHLPAEIKRELIAKLLKENPERSDRATAELVKVDHKTVATVRRKEEDVGSIPHVEKRVDTKGRAQPTRKGWSQPKAQVARVAAISMAKTQEKPGRDDDDVEYSAKETASRQRGAFILRAEDAAGFAFYEGKKVDAAMIVSAKATALAWNQMVEKIDPDSFKRATHVIGEITRFAEFCRTNSPESVAAGILPSELAEVRHNIALIHSWLSRFAALISSEDSPVKSAADRAEARSRGVS